MCARVAATKPTYQCWSKAIEGVQGPPQYSSDWALARRAYFKTFPDFV